jgi:hypothetical protein
MRGQTPVDEEAEPCEPDRLEPGVLVFSPHVPDEESP